MMLDLVSGVLMMWFLLKFFCRLLVMWKMLLSLLMFLFMSRIFGLVFIVVCRLVLMFFVRVICVILVFFFVVGVSE